MEHINCPICKTTFAMIAPGVKLNGEFSCSCDSYHLEFKNNSLSRETYSFYHINTHCYANVIHDRKELQINCIDLDEGWFYPPFEVDFSKIKNIIDKKIKLSNF